MLNDYVGTNLLCAAITLIILMHMAKESYNSTTVRIFKFVLLFAFILSIADALWAHLVAESTNYDENLLARFTDGFVFAVEFSASVACAYAWFYYVDITLDRPFTRTRPRLLLTLVPVAFIIITSFLSLNFDLMFYLDADGYRRGALYPLFMLVVAIYILVASIHALKHGLTAGDPVARTRCRTLAWFAIFPAIFVVLQLFTPVPFVAGIILSIVWCYIDLQGKDISEDSLTGINNRYRMMRELALRMNRSQDNGESLFLLMMDANRFKHINDTFGHDEGDRALINIARALKRAAGNTPHFIARYGGDEFAALMSTEIESEVKAFGDNVNRYLEEMRRSEVQHGSDKLYELSLSIGYARFVPGGIGRRLHQARRRKPLQGQGRTTQKQLIAT